MRKTKTIKAWAVIEESEIIGMFRQPWIFAEKKDAEAMCWDFGKRNEKRKIVPCKITI